MAYSRRSRNVRGYSSVANRKRSGSSSARSARPTSRRVAPAQAVRLIIEHRGASEISRPAFGQVAEKKNKAKY